MNYDEYLKEFKERLNGFIEDKQLIIDLFSDEEFSKKSMFMNMQESVVFLLLMIENLQIKLRNHTDSTEKQKSEAHELRIKTRKLLTEIKELL